MLSKRNIYASAPASAANLGSGYDMLGIALNLKTRINLSPAGEFDAGFYYREPGKPSRKLPLDSLPARFLRLLPSRYRTRINKLFKNYCFNIHNPIPLERGMGSSAACLAAMASLIKKFLPQIELSDLLMTSFKTEGHWDNLFPAFFGGLWIINGKSPSESFPMKFKKKQLSLSFVVPIKEKMNTHMARSLLPATYRKDALKQALFQTGAMIAYLGGSATDHTPEDLVHEPFRLKHLPLASKLLRSLRASGYLAFLSGSGSSVGLVTRKSLPKNLALSPALLDKVNIFHLKPGEGAFNIDTGKKILHGLS